MRYLSVNQGPEIARSSARDFLRLNSLFLLILLAAAARFAQSAATPKLERRKLAQPTEFQGYLCAVGYAWFFPDGKLQSCTVARETHFGEARAPTGSWIRLGNDGTPSLLVVKHDTQISGFLGRGGGFGGGEGYTTSFYPNGQLELCWLSGDQVVQGVPCAGATFTADIFGGGAGTYFYQSGKLKSCKLAKDYANLHRGDRFVQST